MAAQIEKVDGAYRPESEAPSWHQLEDVVPGKITKKDQIPRVAYPVGIEPYPEEEGYIITNSAATHRIVGYSPDGKLVLGSCSNSYVPFGNDMLFDKMFEAFSANNIPAELVFALTMKSGRLASYSFYIPGWSEFMAGGRQHKTFACCSTSHDKTQPAVAFGTAVNVLCANTHNMAMKGRKEGFSFKFFHDKSGKKDFQELPKMLEAVQASAALFSKLADQMAGKTINLQQAKAIAMEILCRKEEPSTQLGNKVEALGDLFVKGIGNNGDDLDDLFNAVTQYYTHGEGVGAKVSVEKKVSSSEFGTGARIKADFLTAFQNKDGELISDTVLDAIIAAGQRKLNLVGV